MIYLASRRAALYSSQASFVLSQLNIFRSLRAFIGASLHSRVKPGFDLEQTLTIGVDISTGSCIALTRARTWLSNFSVESRSRFLSARTFSLMACRNF